MGSDKGAWIEEIARDIQMGGFLGLGGRESAPMVLRVGGGWASIVLCYLWRSDTCTLRQGLFSDFAAADLSTTWKSSGYLGG